MSNRPMRDDEHAATIRAAIDDLLNKLREARADGVMVRLKFVPASGLGRGGDKCTSFTAVAIDEIVRPL